MRWEGSSRTPPFRLVSPLTLVEATYPIEIEGAARLRFDRAVNIDAFDGTQIIIKDGLNQSAVMNATGPVELSDPQTVNVYLVITGPYSEPNVLLSATENSGIVAADDGGRWAGVTDVPLPYPPPPPSQIVSVVHSDTDDDRVVVTTNEPLIDLTDFTQAMEVSLDGGVTWLTPQFYGLPDANVAVLIYEVVVNTATQWRVPNPAVWEFSVGGPLVAPYSGEIE